MAAATHFPVLFEKCAHAAGEERREIAPTIDGAGPALCAVENAELDLLRLELESTRDYLQANSQSQQTTNEALQATMEELQAINEELQSTNEELETTKEELQSTNEEMISVNEELENRNDELTMANDDLVNLQGSINTPIVMLGDDLRIRWFTPLAEKALNLFATDVGRPISDLRINLTITDLEALLREVLDTLVTREVEVQDNNGVWFSLRLRPYKTMENRINGVVMALVEVDALKRGLADAEEARDYAEAILAMVRDPLIVLDGELRVKTANSAFSKTFKLTRGETEGKFIYNLGAGEWDIPRLRELLEDVLPNKSQFENYEVDVNFAQAGYKRLLLNGRRLQGKDNRTKLILLSMEDVMARCPVRE